jgi:hypothetical protein
MISESYTIVVPVVVVIVGTGVADIEGHDNAPETEYCEQSEDYHEIDWIEYCPTTYWCIVNDVLIDFLRQDH